MQARIGRLLRALSPRFAKPDDEWARARLTEQEFELFSAMDPRDREHGLEVARLLTGKYPGAPSYAVRAALLHDAGKSLRPYNLLERVLTGLICPDVPADPLRPGIYGAFQMRRHHPKYAARKIADTEVSRIVLEHHQPRSQWAKRLQEADQEF